MCFSTAVSFGASAVIGVTGFAALKKANNTPQKLFAIIPISFSLQQFAEGLTWFAFTDSTSAEMPFWIPGTSYVFLFFAWILLPFIIPFSIYHLEQDKARKKILSVVLAIGITISLTLTYVLFRYQVFTDISDHHIDYEVSINHPMTWAVNVFYIIATVFSCLLSTRKWVWILGVINLASYTFSTILFASTVISIWCFFAAVSSVLILVIIVDMQKVEENRSPVLT